MVISKHDGGGLAISEDGGGGVAISWETSDDGRLLKVSMTYSKVRHYPCNSVNHVGYEAHMIFLIRLRCLAECDGLRGVNDVQRSCHGYDCSFVSHRLAPFRYWGSVMHAFLFAAPSMSVL